MAKRPLTPAKLYYASTLDGWQIALHRHRAKRAKYPVLLVHGLASNHANMDFPIKDLSLARYLKKNGFDTWIVDLRGSGLSKKRGFGRNRIFVDDFVLQDLPAAVDLILKATQAKKIHYIGHSLGGCLGYGFLANYRRKNIFKSLITIGSPLSPKAKGYFKYLFRLESLLRLIPWVPYKTFSRLANLFVHLVLRLDHHGMYSRGNIDSDIFRAISDHAVENIPTSLYLQIHDWFRNDHFTTRDGTIDFYKQIYECKVPTLVCAGSVDSFTPLKTINGDFRKLSSSKKSLLIFGREHGHINDYGHIDLILGKNAPKEVYPHVLNWIKKHD